MSWRRWQFLGPAVLVTVWAVFLCSASLWSLNESPYWGMQLGMQNGVPSVLSVDPVGWAFPRGIKPGDGVLALNGAPVLDASQLTTDHLNRIAVQDSRGRERVVQAPDRPLALVVLLLAGALLFWGLGLLVFRWSADRALRVLFLLTMLAFGSALATIPVALLQITWAEVVVSVSAITGAPLLVGLFASFPRPVHWRTPLVALLAAVALLLDVGYAALVIGGLGTPPPAAQALSVWFGGNLLLGLGVLVQRVRRETDRAALRPLLAGALVAALPMLALFVAPATVGVEGIPAEYLALTFVALPASFAYAILRHRLLGMDALLRRYAVQVSTLVIAALVFALVWLPLEVMGLTEPTGALLGALVAVAVSPWLGSRVEWLVDRWLFPPLLVIRHGHVLGADESQAAVASVACTRLRDLVPATWCVCVLVTEQRQVLVLGQAGAVPPLAVPDTAWLATVGASVANILPAGAGGTPAAYLVAGRRIDGTPLSGVDLEVLQALAHEIAGPFEAAVLREQLEREEAFRAGLAQLARELAAAATPEAILATVKGHAQRLLQAGELRLLAPPATEDLDPVMVLRQELAQAGFAEAEQDRLFEERCALLRPDTLGLALEGNQPVDAALLLGRAHGAPWNARDVEYGRQIAEQGSTALRRAALATQAAEAEALREVDRWRTEFLSMVSHDLQGPLSIIKGFAELLERRHARDRASADMLREIDAAVGTSTRLVQDLIAAVRLQSGRLVLHPQPVNLAEFLGRLVSAFRPLDSRGRITLETEPDLQVYADRLRLEQIVSNLLSNALRYAPNGPISVRGARADGGQVVIEVQDDGPGIPPSEQSQVWEKFYRAAGVRRNVVGTGLGLSLVQSLVGMHGGQVELESEVGVGSTFRVFLPSGESIVPLAGNGSTHTPATDTPGMAAEA